MPSREQCHHVHSLCHAGAFPCCIAAAWTLADDLAQSLGHDKRPCDAIGHARHNAVLNRFRSATASGRPQGGAPPSGDWWHDGPGAIQPAGGSSRPPSLANADRRGDGSELLLVRSPRSSLAFEGRRVAFRRPVRPPTDFQRAPRRSDNRASSFSTHVSSQGHAAIADTPCPAPACRRRQQELYGPQSPLNSQAPAVSRQLPRCTR